MEIISYNLDFWRRISKYNNFDAKKWLTHINMLLQDPFADFILLQEINPFYVLGKDYDHSNNNIHQFNLFNRNNYYYHELKDALKNECPNDKFWGNAIIAKTNYILLKNHNYVDNKYAGEKYYGYESLMCYDFKVNEKDTVTLINHYKKGLNGNYDYDEGFFNEIQKILKTVNDKNLIFFAGDFNAKSDTLDRITKMGFIEKTKHFENTMVDIKGVKPYHNDCIFVNSKYSEYVNVKRMYGEVDPKEAYEYSDHHGYKSTINL